MVGKKQKEEMVGRGRTTESTSPQPCVVAGEGWRRRKDVGEAEQWWLLAGKFAAVHTAIAVWWEREGIRRRWLGGKDENGTSALAVAGEGGRRKKDGGGKWREIW